MADFIRARSDEQKSQRMADIKLVTDALFRRMPYHEITLTTIADELGWSRANLYKYAATKEEIFLALTADKCAAYFDALLAAFPAGRGCPRDVSAEVWAGVAAAHRDFFRYGSLLVTVVETNVTLGRLVDFKRGYYEGIARLAERLPGVLGVPCERIEGLTLAVYHHGVGLSGTCDCSPLVWQALSVLGREGAPCDFRAEMRDFIAMCLAWYAA